MILCSGITAATYKVLDISLELDAIFEKRFATKIGELYVGTTSIPYQSNINPLSDTISKRHHLEYWR